MKSASEKTSSSESVYLSLAGRRAAAGFQLGMDSSKEGIWSGNVGVGSLAGPPFRRRATSARTRHMMSSIDKLRGVAGVDELFSGFRPLLAALASRTLALLTVVMILPSPLKRNPSRLAGRWPKP